MSTEMANRVIEEYDKNTDESKVATAYVELVRNVENLHLRLMKLSFDLRSVIRYVELLDEEN